MDDHASATKIPSRNVRGRVSALLACALFGGSFRRRLLGGGRHRPDRDAGQGRRQQGADAIRAGSVQVAARRGAHDVRSRSRMSNTSRGAVR
jgi:hypothetical protein